MSLLLFYFFFIFIFCFVLFCFFAFEKIAKGQINKLIKSKFENKEKGTTEMSIAFETGAFNTRSRGAVPLKSV